MRINLDIAFIRIIKTEYFELTKDKYNKMTYAEQIVIKSKIIEIGDIIAKKTLTLKPSEYNRENFTDVFIINEENDVITKYISYIQCNKVGKIFKPISENNYFSIAFDEDEYYSDDLDKRYFTFEIKED